MAEDGYLLSEHAIEAINRTQREVAALRRLVGQLGGGRWAPEQDESYPLIWKNTDDTDCPAHGCIRYDSYETTGNFVNGKRPNGTLHPIYLLNGDLPVAAGGTGQYLLPGGPLSSRIYADVATPGASKSFGPKLNSWEFTEGLDLFFNLGKVSDNIGEGHFQRLTAVLGKRSTALSKGSAGTLDVWRYPGTAWEAFTGITVSARALFGECAANKYCSIEWRGEWICVQVEC